ncbi:hypothetical protein HAX54_029658 [Datura stramonium]|uniref:Polygalacturonase n=1 Tax=Datura stramonium TaxID=4076 RepID=A0ABS8SAC3_DATST|nr:hypothetical protein [Datura stramonium]
MLISFFLALLLPSLILSVPLNSPVFNVLDYELLLVMARLMQPMLSSKHGKQHVHHCLLRQCTFLLAIRSCFIPLEIEALLMDGNIVAPSEPSKWSVSTIFVFNEFHIKHVNGLTDSAVQVSDITFRNIRGTSQGKFAVKLDCSASVPCWVYCGRHTYSQVPKIRPDRILGMHKEVS